MDDFIKTKDGTLIIGEPGYGKTKIIRELKNIYKEQGWKVCWIDVRNLTQEDLTILKQISEELAKRKNQESVQALDKTVLLIDDFDVFLQKSKDKSVYEVFQNINDFGQQVGFSFVISVKNKNELPNTIYQNIKNKIYLGTSALEVRPTALAFGTLAYVDGTAEDIKPVLKIY